MTQEELQTLTAKLATELEATTKPAGVRYLLILECNAATVAIDAATSNMSFTSAIASLKALVKNLEMASTAPTSETQH